MENTSELSRSYAGFIMTVGSYWVVIGRKICVLWKTGEPLCEVLLHRVWFWITEIFTVASGHSWCNFFKKINESGFSLKYTYLWVKTIKQNGICVLLDLPSNGPSIAWIISN